MNALQRYLKAYKTVSGQDILSLSELPDFHLISTHDGFSLESKDLRGGMFLGYFYDLQCFEDGRYVISASPLGMFHAPVEFGITDKGFLKMNNKSVDPEPDDYEEVTGWRRIRRLDQVRSKALPDYIDN